MKKDKGKTGFRNSKLFCFNCGQSFDLQLPQPVTMAGEMMKVFAKAHENCAPVWKEPEVTNEQSIEDRMRFWITQGERGVSSETIYQTLSGQVICRRESHPHDPDDFKRCYKLLQIIPEWKNDIHKLKKLSTAWNNLVDNWDKLTEMYEQNEKEQWKNYKNIGMYEFMQTLTRQ